MRVRGLDGRSHPWDLRDREVGKMDDIARSQLHLSVRALLHQMFPTDPILEEVPLPGSGGLTADFYLPVRKLIVEAHGAQHLRFVAFYHRTTHGFRDQQKRDQNKIVWSEINGMRLVALHHNEDESQWIQKLLSG